MTTLQTLSQGGMDKASGVVGFGALKGCEKLGILEGLGFLGFAI